MTNIASATPRSCQTCLYCGTHEKCEGCLSTEEDYAEYRSIMDSNKGKPIPQWARPELPSRYLNWEEGNGLDRWIQYGIEGKRNIVIGGQGEAETNTQWTPEQTAEHLYYVAGQCGYMCGSLRHDQHSHQWKLEISTHDGTFELVWDDAGKLLRIYDVNHTGGWKWDNYNPFRDKEPRN